MTLDEASLAMFAAGLLIWVGIVHLTLAFGVRRGEMVWSGRYARLLSPPYRRRSLAYGVFALFASWLFAYYADLVEVAPVPHRWLRSAGWIVSVFLGLIGLYGVVKGTIWERLLLGPIALFGAALAGWLTFG